MELRAELARLGQPPLLCPRIFVSHRQADEKHGLRIAKLATGGGFGFWLDALDPWLNALQNKPPGSLSKRQETFLTAGIIEIALVNCSHVIALLTPNMRGTLWVPYEYGRVKDVPIGSLRAGAWIDPGLSPQDLPEYTVLGVMTHKEQEICSWHETELVSWSATCPTGAGESWDDLNHLTELLPGSEPES